MEFSPDVQVRKHAELFDELFERVLWNEEPFFVSDEATIYDVSTASPEELLRRLSEYYGVQRLPRDLRMQRTLRVEWHDHASGATLVDSMTALRSDQFKPGLEQPRLQLGRGQPRLFRQP